MDDEEIFDALVAFCDAYSNNLVDIYCVNLLRMCGSWESVVDYMIGDERYEYEEDDDDKSSDIELPDWLQFDLTELHEKIEQWYNEMFPTPKTQEARDALEEFYSHCEENEQVFDEYFSRDAVIKLFLEVSDSLHD